MYMYISYDCILRMLGLFLPQSPAISSSTLPENDCSDISYKQQQQQQQHIPSFHVNTKQHISVYMWNLCIMVTLWPNKAQ